MKEQLFPSDVLSIADLRTILPSLIPTDRPVLVASDFDETLCNTYIYDPVTQNHIPQLNPDLVSLVTEKKIPLIIVTSRAASEVAVQQVLIPFIDSVGGMVVCENGGVIINNQREQIVIATPEEQAELAAVREEIAATRFFMYTSGIEVVKRNDRLASIELRAQSKINGEGSPGLQDMLALMVHQCHITENLMVVSSGNSVSIQPKSISKARGLRAALQLHNIERDEMFVIAMGDGANDKELLQDSNIGIAVDEPAKTFANVLVKGGENTAIAVFECL